MKPAKQLFRKVALERLSSPEQLDVLMRVIRPADWLIFAPLAALLMLAMAWGWYGSIPTKVSGRCILINPTGLADVTAAAGGRLASLSVQVGDRVQRGQDIALVALPELGDQIDKARDKLAELEAQRLRVRSFASRGSQLATDLIERQRLMLQAQQRSGEERIRLLRERVDSQAQLLAQGLITNQTLLSTRQELNAAQIELSNIASQLAQLGLRRLESDKQLEGENSAIDQQIEERKRQLDSLMRSRNNTAVVTSPFTGRVIEVKAGLGMLLAPGMPVLSVEQDEPAAGQSLEAAIFVPAGDGKRVAPGMMAQVSPATVKREEHGYLLARVHYVAEYPSSTQRMQMLLQNDVLVKELAGTLPPIEIRASLQPARNPSGFAWSSSAGPPTRVRSGTLCQADIVVETRSPISLVVPQLKKSLGVE